MTMLLVEEEEPGVIESAESDQIHFTDMSPAIDQTLAMEGDGIARRVILILILCYVMGFVVMVTSICTSSWYTTHPLAPTTQTSYGSLGLIKHCSTAKGVCLAREEILKFSDHYWPYRPLKNQDFDTTLLTLILSMMCTMAALGVTLVIRMDFFNQKRWLKQMHLLVSTINAVLGISGVSYFDIQVRSEQFRRSWSTYLAWLSVGLSVLAIIPAVYLVRLKVPLSGTVKIEGFTGSSQTGNEHKQQLSLLLHKKHFQYLDIHDVE